MKVESVVSWILGYDGSSSIGWWLTTLMSSLNLSEETLAVELRVHPMVVREVMLDVREMNEAMALKLERYLDAPVGLFSNMQARRNLWLHQQTPEYLEACKRWDPVGNASLDDLITMMKGSGIRRLS